MPGAWRRLFSVILWFYQYKQPRISMHVCMPAKSLQSYPSLCDIIDHSPPGSSVHGILWARILEWVAMPSFRGSSWPRDRTCISLCLLHWQVGSLPLAPSGKAVEWEQHGFITFQLCSFEWIDLILWALILSQNGVHLQALLTWLVELKCVQPQARGMRLLNGNYFYN